MWRLLDEAGLSDELGVDAAIKPNSAAEMVEARRPRPGHRHRRLQQAPELLPEALDLLRAGVQALRRTGITSRRTATAWRTAAAHPQSHQGDIVSRSPLS